MHEIMVYLWVRHTNGMFQDAKIKRHNIFFSFWNFKSYISFYFRVIKVVSEEINDSRMNYFSFYFWMTIFLQNTSVDAKPESLQNSTYINSVLLRDYKTLWLAFTVGQILNDLHPPLGDVLGGRLTPYFYRDIANTVFTSTSRAKNNYKFCVFRRVFTRA